MVRRYGHLAAEHLAGYAGNTATRKVTAQIRHKHRISTAHPFCELLENKEIDGGQGQNRTTDTRIFSTFQKRAK
jgi:hypothetical protein